MTIGKLEEIPLREVWKHEERGFSAWLENNLDSLSNVVGLELTEARREVKAGSFSVDIVAEDGNSDGVIIENQLEATDHDHLGKVLTYLTNLEAKTAIWITSNPRPEHIRAIQWLNETTPDDISFFLVKLTAIRINDSVPAPLFTVIVAPSQISKDFGKQKKDLAERHILRLRFWEQFLETAKEKGINQLSGRTPSKDHWLSVGSGKSGLNFNYYVMRDRAEIDLYIDKGNKEENEDIFDKLSINKENIEESFGKPLIWNKLDEKRASRIKYTIINNGGLRDEEKWREIQEILLIEMENFSNAIKPYIAKLR